LLEGGITLDELTVKDGDEIRKLINQYRDKFVRIMMPQMPKMTWRRATSGPFVNVDEALVGESACYRRNLVSGKGPLRIGINVSRTNNATEIVAIRGAAVLAFIELCKARGRQVVVELAYGNGRECPLGIQCHVRILLNAPNTELLTRVCCSDRTIHAVGNKMVLPLGDKWMGYYRFHEFNWNEYDFVLDRIETSDKETEYNRVMKQLETLKVI
jgi:hypothetical protein